MARNWGPCAGALVGTLCLGLVATDARAGCEKDTDCKGGRVCTAGACVEPAAPKCQSDKDCSGELVCNEGECGARQPQAQQPPAAAPPPAASGPSPPPAAYGYGPPPAGWPQGLPPRQEHRSTGLMIAGAVLLPIGFLAAIAGGPVAAGITAANDDPYPLPALSCLVPGSVFTVMGIVFLAVGAPEVPVVPEQGKSAIYLEPIVGPTSAGMRVTF
jgi:hypothetical protein